MGIIICQDCDGYVSNNADSCPHCGNKRFIQQWIERKNDREREILIQKEQARRNAMDAGFSNVEDWRKAQELKKRKEEFNKKLLDYFFRIVVAIVVIFFLYFLFPGLFEIG